MITPIDKMDIYKKEVGNEAASLITPGMKVGLGSGSTAAWVVRSLGRRWKEEGLRFIGVPTSVATAQLAESLGIELTTLGQCPELDITIDGADEVEKGNLNLIKGLGGALLREKIVCYASKRFVIVVDDSKIVNKLGDHTPVPVEVTPFGWEATAKYLEKLGAKITIRQNKENQETYITDGKNMILDCNFGLIHDAFKLEQELRSIVGVVENGLFIHRANEVLIAGHNGMSRLKRS